MCHPLCNRLVTKKTLFSKRLKLISLWSVNRTKQGNAYDWKLLCLIIQFQYYGIIYNSIIESIYWISSSIIKLQFKMILQFANFIKNKQNVSNVIKRQFLTSFTASDQIFIVILNEYLLLKTLGSNTLINWTKF